MCAPILFVGAVVVAGHSGAAIVVAAPSTGRGCARPAVMGIDFGEVSFN